MQCLSEHRHRSDECVVLDERFRPALTKQLVLLDNLSAGFDENEEDSQRFFE
jgi:hypothetical protein